MERKKIIVLGGSSGIGKATAIRFANEGCQVMIASNDKLGAEQVRDSLAGTGHYSVYVDVQFEEEILNLSKQISSLFGEFDVLINSIGIPVNQSILSSEFDAWDAGLQVMLYGTIKTCRMLVPLMKNGGRVINITSIHAFRAEQGSSGYAVAKAAINQFTRSLALELAPRKILANTVAPGFIDAPLARNEFGVNELETTWFYDNYIKYDHLPLKRAGRPEEVAGVIHFLAGPDASYITGINLIVDGGLTITF